MRSTTSRSTTNKARAGPAKRKGARPLPGRAPHSFIGLRCCIANVKVARHPSLVKTTSGYEHTAKQARRA